MYLLSWNVDQLGAGKRIKTVADEIASTAPAMVTLQEVSSKNASSVAEALKGCGLAHVWHGHDPPPCSDRDVKKGYHCVIASRWPLSDPPGGEAWRCPAPFPEVLGRVTVDSSEGKVDVFTTHIPHGSRRWRDGASAGTPARPAPCRLVLRCPVGSRGHITSRPARCIPGPVGVAAASAVAGSPLVECCHSM